ncbi:bacteriocin biosynthesis protein SagD [Streptomyces eurocidicus]|uniref:Bacteriocin biosynthesis protein SagD n=1 Tax=Streptomyces eurocidicus TaxID=66423 RepID=A0A2N8P104_STREU|nr:TOMM precursor leader peptide-binding protein [Streptomyces eurocidicus]MBB5121814.1 ribosomal protein S12 methylthiotransferase accessory factor [Streptomyces eurocidicus]MBF6055080.1 TOMM precursor leader peptide-binding protein [Streptomyces eurocidicus]PNE34681.1 bacteriocin biosynthesis protein SagD [Streptomyces eurocidicus]
MTAPLARPPGAAPHAARDLLRGRLAEAGLPAADVAVRQLGARDELAARPRRIPSPGSAPVPVQLYGRTALLGPVPDPDRSGGPCGQCLARRWQAIRHQPVRDALELGGPTRAAGANPYLAPFALDAMATVIGAALTGEQRPADPGSPGYPLVHRLDMERGLVRSFPLVPDPECPACGEREADAPARVSLPSAPKRRPGDFRPRPARDYALPLAAFANPVCGTLGPGTALELDALGTAPAVGAFAQRSGRYLYEVMWGGHTTAYRDSVAVGVLEGLERCAGMRSRTRATAVVTSLRALRARGQRAVDPRECGLYAPGFYAAQERVRPFSETRDLPWVWGWSLTHEEPVLLPEVLAYYHSTPLEERFVQECSNGCATGSSVTEAVHFGLMELIERDAFLLAWYGRAELPEIDPRSSRSATTRHLVDRLALHGYDARFFDARVTLPVPVVIAAAVRADGGPGALCFGAGASPDPESALRSGLAEIATDAPRLRRRTLDRLPELKAMARDFTAVRSLNDHPLLYGLPEMTRHAAFLLGEPGTAPRPRLPLREIYRGGRAAPVPAMDLVQDVHACVRALAAGGFEAIVVDQTLPEQRAAGARTVSVTVPGLLPIDFGQDRQRALLMPRMRTALRAAGLRDHNLAPADLNPAPHPFP